MTFFTSPRLVKPTFAHNAYNAQSFSPRHNANRIESSTSTLARARGNFSFPFASLRLRVRKNEAG